MYLLPVGSSQTEVRETEILSELQNPQPSPAVELNRLLIDHILPTRNIQLTIKICLK